MNAVEGVVLAFVDSCCSMLCGLVRKCMNGGSEKTPLRDEEKQDQWCFV